MPELPEVERARRLIQDALRGYKIKSVQTTEDKIVYAGGITHDEFGREIEGRTIESCERKGKIFWLNLSGKGRMPMMHFGMTGMIQLKGQEPTWYRRRPRENTNVWPPKYCKFVMQLEPQKGSVSDEPRELAFMDARRLARLRLLATPVLEQPPVSQLGFDPVDSHPTLEEFQNLLSKKKGTIKGVIMDQSFSAGVGNWVADEILYQSRIHPACPVPALSEESVKALHHWTRQIPLIAVEAYSDHANFPTDWLFRWRWGKGKSKKVKGKGRAKKAEVESDPDSDEDITPKEEPFMKLPDGGQATIGWIEVGGRTTAVVEEMQKMPEGVEIKAKVPRGGKGSKGKKKEGDASESDVEMSDSGAEDVKPKTITTPKRKSSTRKTAVKEESTSASDEEEKPSVQATTPRQKAAAVKKAKLNDGDTAVKTEVATPAKKPRKSATKSSGGKGQGGKSSRGGRGGGRAVKVEMDGGGASDSSDLSDAPE